MLTRLLSPFPSDINPKRKTQPAHAHWVRFKATPHKMAPAVVNPCAGLVQQLLLPRQIVAFAPDSFPPPSKLEDWGAVLISIDGFFYRRRLKYSWKGNHNLQTKRHWTFELCLSLEKRSCGESKHLHLHLLYLRIPQQGSNPDRGGLLSSYKRKW